MADLKIFMVHEDFIDLCTFMIEKFQAEFFPETVFGNSIISGLKTIEEIKFHLYNFPPDYSLSFFITSPLWTIEPIYYTRIEKEGIEQYFVLQRYGGPSIHFIPSFSFPKIHTKKIIIGMISDYSYYISGSFLNTKDKEYKTINRPPSMKNAFTEIKKYINQKSKKVTYKGKTTKTARVLQNAQNLVEKGYNLYEGELKYQ
jgi:hypothetical protein